MKALCVAEGEGDETEVAKDLLEFDTAAAEEVALLTRHSQQMGEADQTA